jgi:hypothetical protein
MHGIHPCKDGTLRGNLVFQKLDVVATILQIQCPSAGRRPSQRLFFLCDSPCNQLQNLSSTSRYIAGPDKYMPRPAQYPRLLPCFRYIGDRYSPQSRRSTEAGYAIYAPFFLAAHRAFIMADNLFRMAALMGFRPAVFFWAGAAFFGAA